MRSDPVKILLVFSLLIFLQTKETSSQATKGQTFRTHTFTLMSGKNTQSLPDSVVKIAFLGTGSIGRMDKESRSAFDFLKTMKGFFPVYVTFDEIRKNPKLLDSYKVAWFHRQDTSCLLYTSPSPRDS